MSKVKKGLGMGLDALFKMNVQDQEQDSQDAEIEKKVIAGFTELPIDQIKPNPEQPRKKFDELALNELAQSIKSFGLIQPITVIKKGDFYEIVTGERRYRASKKVGLEKIPVIIKDLSQKEKLEMSLVENIQRENLNSIEEALAFSSLIENYNITQEELASTLGKSRTSITNSIRLLNLDVQIKSWIIEGKLTAGHARAILSIEDPRQHLSFANYIIMHDLSVREAENTAKKWPIKQKKSSQVQVKNIEFKNVEEKLQRSLQTKVIITGSKNKGKIAIDYYSQDELERIIEIICSKK